jgi:LPS-assembly lipoprotein
MPPAPSAPRARPRLPILARVATLAAVFLVASCGFHPRGTVRLPAGISAVHVSSSDKALAESLRSSLVAAGARVVSTPAEADLVVRITDADRNRRLAAVDPKTARPSAYELSYGLTYRATRRDGSDILPPETVSLVHDYTFSPQAVLAKGGEESLIFAEMREDLAQHILRRLRTVLEATPRPDADQP